MTSATTRAEDLERRVTGNIKPKCDHNHYRQDGYMQYEKAIKDPGICWIGKIEKTCKDCGMNIEFARRVRVKTADQYMKSLN